MYHYSWIDVYKNLINDDAVGGHFLGMVVYCRETSQTKSTFLKHNPTIEGQWEDIEPMHPDVIYLKTRMLIEGIPF